MLLLLSVQLRNLIFRGCTKVVRLKNRAIAGIPGFCATVPLFPHFFSYARGEIFRAETIFYFRVKFYVGGVAHWHKLRGDPQIRTVAGFFLCHFCAAPC